MSDETSNNFNVPAVVGKNTAGGFGLEGKSNNGVGIHGANVGKSSEAANIGPDRGAGVWGESLNGFGLFGSSNENIGVFGNSVNGFGIKAVSQKNVGLSAEGPTLAAFFRGDVQVVGNLTMLNGGDIRLADFAEDFDISALEEIEPGSVVVLDDDGSVQQSRKAYDHKVAGVVSGAGNFRSAITLDRHESQSARQAIALMGKVYCKVDAQYSAIGIGDLLTTSETLGHAMKAVDPLKAFGAVIGKALRPMQSGQGIIPVLVALQ